MATKTKRTIESEKPAAPAGPSVHVVREIAFKLGALAEAAQRFAEEPAYRGRLITVLAALEELAA